MLDTILRERILAVEERLTAACRRSGRARGDVVLVAVTKTVSAELAALLPGLGLRELGENRPQELWHKASFAVRHKSAHAEREDSPEIHWHMIGHLQRNKIERTLPLVQMIHSVDSVRLLQAIDAEAARQGLQPTVLLEVNTSGEASKQGFEPARVVELAPAIHTLRHVRVRGLMTMAAFQEPESCRPCFVLLRILRDQLSKSLGPESALAHLSMGMTNDFEIAVEEGATLVRLGTVLFGGLENELRIGEPGA